MKELLYQKNYSNKTVNFAIVQDGEDTTEALSHNNTFILPFNEIIRKSEELKYYFREYERTVFNIIELVTKAKDKFMIEIDQLKKTELYNQNIFFHYYSNVILNNAFNARNVINRSLFHIFTFNSIVNTSKSNIYSTVNSIRDTLFTNWYENNQNESNLNCIEFNKKTVFYQDGIHSEIYTVADDSLFNFFFDFNKALLKEKEDDIINCSNNTDDFDEDINDYFYVEESSHNESQTDYCKQISCQEILLLPRKRKKRTKNNPCKDPINTIEVYFRSEVLKLKKDCSSIASEELKKQKNTFYDEIKEIVSEYNFEKRSTICPEMKSIIEKIEKKINIESDKIRTKYKNEKSHDIPINDKE